MVLKFCNAKGKEKEIAVLQEQRDVERTIKKYGADRNYRIDNLSTTVVGNKIIYDFGSWSEFFILYLENDG